MARTFRTLPFMAAAAVLVLPIAAGSSTASPEDELSPRAQPARGMTYAGLVKSDRGPCGDAYRAKGAGRPAVCTHGPDPAPPRVDVTVRRSLADLTASTSGGTTSTATVPCVGDGTTGPRVQAVYAVSSDRPSRYADVAPLISAWAGQMDEVVATSAQATGGERHIRFVTGADCSLDVLNVTLTATGDDSFSNMVSELRSQGFTRTDRKYLVWVDATVYCGIGQLGGDDTDSASNPANSGPTFARVDSGCWGRSDHLSEVHELMHTLGAVQRSAPHGTSGFHCTDESDLMCYPDAVGVTMTQDCALTQEWLLDCNHDDYFHANPPAGSYLDTHWNVADSVFLVGGGQSGGGSEGGGTTTSTATTSTTWTGSVSAKRPVKTFTTSVGGGASSSALTFGGSGKGKSAGSASLTLRILRPDGSTVAAATGPSVLRIATDLGAGSYTWEVSGTSSVSFSLTSTYVQP